MLETVPIPKIPFPSYKALLVHLSDQVVDQVFTVTQVTAFDEMLELPLVKAAGGAVELERPQEVGSLFEVGADGVNLVDEIFHTDHARLILANAGQCSSVMLSYPYLPSCSSMISLSVSGIRCLSTLP
jgi:hypothetical protein